MTQLSLDVFRPREGAVLDLASLQTLATAQSAALRAWLAARWSGASGLVLEGLELKGDVSPGGPPGSVRPDPESSGAVVTPGRAVITGRDGALHLVEVDEPVHVPWPDASGPRVRGALVLYAAQQAAAAEGGIAVARETLRVHVGFVRPDAAHARHLLPLAISVGNGLDWGADLFRVLRPEHPAVQHLLKRLEGLEHSVWNADPEGSVWDRQVLGRSWVRYQTVAASALQAARVQLSTFALTTEERVRLLAALKDQLERSVERVATELLQLVGPADGAGPYRRVTGADR